MDLLQRTQIQKASELLNSASRQEEKIDNGIGLSDREIRSYSTLTAIQKKYDSIIHRRPFDGLESECHATISKRLGEPTSAGVIYIPDEILYRDLTAGIFSTGGALVSLKNISFIEILRNRTVVFKLGVRRMPGQTQQITIPKQSGSATHYWLSTEATNITESQQVFGQVALTPKTVGAYTEVSRQLLLQSNPAAESIVMSDLASVLGVAVSDGVINGTGASGEPLGVLNTSGIGTVSGTSLAYAGLIEFQQDVADANAVLNPDTLGYVTTPSVAGLLKSRQRFTGSDSPLWRGSLHTGEIEGVPAYSTKQVPAGSMIYGDWSQVVVAEWGNLAIEVNPFADFKAGIIGIRGLWSVDIVVRHAESFSVATSIT